MINLNKNTDGSTDDFFRGDNLQFEFEVLRDGNKMTDLDTYTWKMSIKNGEKNIINTGGSYLTVTSDRVSVNIPPEVTQNFITNSNIIIEIQMSATDKDFVKTVFCGSIRAQEDIVK